MAISIKQLEPNAYLKASGQIPIEFNSELEQELKQQLGDIQKHTLFFNAYALLENHEADKAFTRFLDQVTAVAHNEKTLRAMRLEGRTLPEKKPKEEHSHHDQESLTALFLNRVRAYYPYYYFKEIQENDSEVKKFNLEHHVLLEDLLAQSSKEADDEFNRLVNLPGEQCKIIRQKAEKLRELWLLANKHIEETDKESQEKGFMAKQLVINLLKETKKSIAVDGTIQNPEQFQKNWAKHYNEAEPILKKSRNYAAILADLITAPVLFILQVAYRSYSGTWGMFSASKTFITAIEAGELVRQLPKPKMPGR
jgi:hypothetical protein